MIAPATAPDAVGNLMQSFSAAAYRGKTVRLRAWVRVEAGTPGDRAQMWLKVYRPNGKTGFYDDMDDRPVRDAEWTNCEIVAEVDRDAQFLDFGVRSIGRGRVWVDEVWFEIVPEEQVTAVRNAIGRLYARTDTTLSGFRFSGPQAVATARTVTQRGEFSLVRRRAIPGAAPKTVGSSPSTCRSPAPTRGRPPTPTWCAPLPTMCGGSPRPLERIASVCVPPRHAWRFTAATCRKGRERHVLAAAEMTGFVLELAKVPAIRRWAGGWASRTCSTGSPAHSPKLRRSDFPGSEVGRPLIAGWYLSLSLIPSSSRCEGD